MNFRSGRLETLNIIYSENSSSKGVTATYRKDNDEYWSDDIPWATVKDFKSLSLDSTQNLRISYLSTK